jgi:hypothetical protein
MRTKLNITRNIELKLADNLQISQIEFLDIDILSVI